MRKLALARLSSAALLVFALTLVSSVVAPATAAAQAQVERSLTVQVPLELRYLLFVPEADEGTKLPVLVFLHGAGERGDDLEKVKVHGPPKIVETRKDFPFIVVSPQCEPRARWRPQAVLALIDHIVSEHPVDTDRIYLTGLSMGGYGTWDTAALAPDRFAAVAPICGGGDPERAAALVGLPLWAFHGGKDTVVPPERSTTMVEAIREAGGADDVRLTIYPEAGHDSWTETYDNPKLWEWFLSHRRSDRETTSARARELPRAAPAEVGLDAERLAGIDETVEAMVESGRIAGAITVVARRGAVAYEKAIGKRDLESGEDLTLDTIVRIYSMSKPITTAALLALWEDGLYELDDPVAEYLPELADIRVFEDEVDGEIRTDPAKRPMTIRDLMRHTSGLTYGYFGSTPIDREYRERAVLAPDTDLDGMMKKLVEIPLLYQPGERWVYSVSVDVQGRLIEVLSGETFDAFLEERIFGPLDMRDTGFFVPADELDRFAVTYSPGDGKLTATDRPSSSNFSKRPLLLSGGGGMVSTARDYLRFASMLANGGELGGVRVLRAETVEAMRTNQLDDALVPIAVGASPMVGTGFGLGVSVRVEAGDAPVGEYGWSGAASTHFWISPKHDLVVVTLSQLMPYSDQLQGALKPVIYGALTD